MTGLTSLSVSFALIALSLLGCAVRAPSSAPVATPTLSATGGPSRIDITVSEEGFSPKRIKVARNRPVTLVFTRITDRTCAKDVVIYVDDANVITRELPLGRPVEVTVTFPRAGERGFACRMKMHGTAVLVE